MLPLHPRASNVGFFLTDSDYKTLPRSATYAESGGRDLRRPQQRSEWGRMCRNGCNLLAKGCSAAPLLLGRACAQHPCSPLSTTPSSLSSLSHSITPSIFYASLSFSIPAGWVLKLGEWQEYSSAREQPASPWTSPEQAASCSRPPSKASG